MMWESIDERLALLELLTEGSLKRRKSQQRAFLWLRELRWTRAVGGAKQLALVPEHRADLIKLLDRVWPSWREAQLDLECAGEPFSPRGWANLSEASRAVVDRALPEQLNRHTAAALSGAHAKVSMTASRRERLVDTQITADGLLRLRPPPGLVAVRGDKEMELDALVELFGEVGLPDRALGGGVRLLGEVRAILLVENLGAWRDMEQPQGWLLAYVPGWNTACARTFLSTLGDTPRLLFGDLDPNGLRIFRHLREADPQLRWFVPPFCLEFLPEHGLPCSWPEELRAGALPPPVRELAAQDKMLEQEPLAVDPRLVHALEDSL